MWKKSAILLSIVSVVGLAGAVEATVPAGEETVIDSGVTNNTTVEFDGELSLLEPGFNQSNVTVNPDYSVSPGEYTGSADFGNHSKSYTVSVSPTVDWNLSANSINRTLSLSSSGEIEDVQVLADSNINPSFDASINGNVSEFLFFNFFRRENTGNWTSVLGYGVDSEQSSGFYRGELVVNNSDTGTSRSVNLSIDLEDNIAPSIESTSFPDFMATQDQSVSAVVRDNLGVVNVSASIEKVVSVEEENETVRKNETFQSIEFERESDNKDRWTYTLTETDDITTYYANITVEDQAGNTIHQLEKYRINGLEAVNVLEPNFEFEAVKPDKGAEKQVLDLDVATPVTLKLKNFQHDVQNSSITVGVRKEGEATPENFGDNEELEIEESGTYLLVVKSPVEDDDYSGQIEVDPVPQHVEVEDIVFQGQVVDPEYPDPDNFSIGEFRGEIRFVDEDKAVKQHIEFSGRAPASDCRGVDTWSQCLQGFSLGEIPEIKAEAQSAKNQRNFAVVTTGVLWVLFGFYIRKKQNKGKISVKPRVKT